MRLYVRICSAGLDKRSQSTDRNTRPANTQKCTPTSITCFTHPPTTNHKCTRPHRPHPLLHSHHTPARNMRAHASSRTRSHRCTHPLARAPTLAHRHILSCVRTDSAQTRARAHTTCTRPLAYAHTLWRAHTLALQPRGAEREQPPGARLGAARRGRGAGRCRSCLPEPRPPDSPREPRQLAPGRVEQGRPGHAGARDRSAAGSAPWTPRRVAARRMTAWTRAPRLEGEPRGQGRAGGEGRHSPSRAAALPGRGPSWTARRSRLGWPWATRAAPASGSLGEAGGAEVSPSGWALRTERRGSWLPGSGRSPP